MADFSQLLFDRLIYVDRLTRAGIAEEQARAHADALNEALRDAVATKHDIERLEYKIEAATLRLTVRVGAMAAAAVAAIISSMPALKALGWM